MSASTVIDNIAKSVTSNDFKNIWYQITNKTKDQKEILLKDREDYGWSLFNPYDSFFQSCVEILTSKEDGKKIKEIYDLLARIEQNNKDIEKLKEKHFTAPESSWNPLVDTQKEIMEDIEDLKKENEKIENKINDLKFALVESFNSHGIEIDRTQLDFIIASVVKEDLANLILVTDTLKQVLFAIEKQMVEGGDHIIVKNYTAVYLVVILTLRHAQDHAIESLNKNSKKVDTLIQVAKENINEACRISGYEHDRTLQSNIKLNERTIEISKAYKEILLKFSRQLQEERPNLERSIKIARNLYNTVETANNLITVIKQSSSNYQSLFKFTMPKINQSYATNMSHEFDSISARLKELG